MQGPTLKILDDSLAGVPPPFFMDNFIDFMLQIGGKLEGHPVHRDIDFLNKVIPIVDIQKALPKGRITQQRGKGASRLKCGFGALLKWKPMFQRMYSSR